MRYRLATVDDYPAIIDFLAGTKYFDPPPYPGGHWIIAEQSGAIVATFWFFAEPPYGYIDYWAGTGVPAVAVAQIGEAIAKGLGVRRMFGTVQLENERALLVLLKRFNAQCNGHGYYLLYKDLDYGNEEDRDSDNDTPAGGPGEQPVTAPPGPGTG